VDKLGKEDQTVRDNVTISYQGASYEIGRGEHFYGIWAAGAPRSMPLEWWPETADGWYAAWSRFTAIVPPGSIVAAGQPGAPGSTPAPGPGGGSPAPARGTRTVVAAGLLFLGVVCGLAGLFPHYVGGQSLASQPDELVAHLIYLAAWTGSAVLVLRGGARMQEGALIGTGVSVVTLGMFLADVGQKIAGSTAGGGLWLGLVGWLACTVGAGYALRLASAGRPARRRGREVGPIAMVLIAGVGAACAFAPAWDSYVLRAASGASLSVTAGNAFANPGVIIAANVITMVLIVAAVAAAALWRPVRRGGLLLAGAVIPLLAQAISALVQAGQSTSPALFGYSPSQAAQIGLTISNGLTPAFWVYCVFVVALAVACAWMFLTPDSATLELPHLSQARQPGSWAAFPGMATTAAPGFAAWPGAAPAPGAQAWPGAAPPPGAPVGEDADDADDFDDWGDLEDSDVIERGSDLEDPHDTEYGPDPASTPDPTGAPAATVTPAATAATAIEHVVGPQGTDSALTTENAPGTDSAPSTENAPGTENALSTGNAPGTDSALSTGNAPATENALATETASGTVDADGVPGASASSSPAPPGDEPVGSGGD
jgi:hypothetical protein